eukprot:SM000072S21174  [mRNA]  locus=s72:97305:104460:+ [translate_table: standard]
MKSLKKQVSHGPTCRSLALLLAGACVIAIGLGPKLRIHRGGAYEDEDVADGYGSDDLRRIKPTVTATAGRQARERREREEALVRDAREQFGQAAGGGKSSGRGAIHVIVTSNGSPYLNWQNRIMYHTYQKVAALPESDMKYFTRVLHRSKPDALMEEIPTFRVEPLDATCDEWCEYPVASRPNAIQQWLDSDDPKGDWVFMIETDYVFVKPARIPATGRAIGFPFGYISPTHGAVSSVMERHGYACRLPCSSFRDSVSSYFPEGDVKDIPGTGNAPTLMPTSELRRVVPLWVDLTAKIEADEDAKQALGWVREMYAFSLAAAKAKVEIDLPAMPGAIMSQPPADEVVGDALLLHYTWGSVIKDHESQRVVWSFDKRTYTARGMPDRILEPPQDLATEAQKVLIQMMNEAIDSLPKYTNTELLELQGVENKTPAQIEAIKAEDATRLAKTGGLSSSALQGTGRTKDWVEPPPGTGIHVMVTSNGNAYMNWQARIMYYTFLKVAAVPGSDMKWFTRVLHRMTEDDLMFEIHTLRVDPLDPKCDVWCDYPVASRPWAIQQWLNSGDVKGDWVAMIETDYVFVKPLDIPVSGRALGFPFGYIIPTYPSIEKTMHKFYPGNLSDIPGTGNAPVVLKTEDLRRVNPIWVKITAQIEADSVAKEELGWVREMYAFSISAALAKMPIDLPPVPHAIMVQPPADSILGDAAIIHYTWGQDIKTESGTLLWHWDKRDYTTGGLPKPIPEPPEGMATSLQTIFVKSMNEALTTLPHDPKSAP